MKDSLKKLALTFIKFLGKLFLLTIYIISKLIEGICIGINKTLESYLK